MVESRKRELRCNIRYLYMISRSSPWKNLSCNSYRHIAINNNLTANSVKIHPVPKIYRHLDCISVIMLAKLHFSQFNFNLHMNKIIVVVIQVLLNEQHTQQTPTWDFTNFNSYVVGVLGVIRTSELEQHDVTCVYNDCVKHRTYYSIAMM